MTALAWVDGRVGPLADAVLPLTTEGLLRGDGAFETVGVWGGRPFRLDAHLDRLVRSLRALMLPQPDLDRLAGAVAELRERFGPHDGMLRISVLSGGTQLVTLAPQPVRPDITTLLSRPAPWIRPLGTFGPAGAKSLSYAANMAALRAAEAAGAQDALLVSLEGLVLEGTTFAVLWVRDGVLRTPAVDLGIVDSISRQSLLDLAREAGVPVEEGRWPLEELREASEVLVCSSVRPCTAIRRLDAWTYEGPAPVCARIGPLLDAARRAP